MDLFLQSALIGFTLAVIIGPIATLCIHRTVTGGLISGIAVGLGASTADALYGAIAAFGLTLITHFLITHEKILSIIGALFLIFLAINILRDKKKHTTAEISLNPFRSYCEVVLLTLTNPMTIIVFLSFFSGAGFNSYPTHNPLLIVLGVFCGSITFYTILVMLILLVNKKMPLSRHLNPITAIIIVIFSLNILSKSLY